MLQGNSTKCKKKSSSLWGWCKRKWFWSDFFSLWPRRRCRKNVWCSHVRTGMNIWPLFESIYFWNRWELVITNWLERSFVSKKKQPQFRCMRKLVSWFSFLKKFNFSSAGLTVGDPVMRTRKPLSVELGPGLELFLQSLYWIFFQV